MFAVDAIRKLARQQAQCVLRSDQTEELDALDEAGGVPTSDPTKPVASTMNVAISRLDSEAAMLALEVVAAISNGSACTSQNYTASHVLTAMGLSEDHVKGALRFSWCHLTPKVDWDEVVSTIKTMAT